MAGLIGVARYEYRMLIRKWGLWVLVIAVGVGAYRFLSIPAAVSAQWSVRQQVGTYAIGVNYLVLVVIGCYLADRIVRDRRLGITELFDTFPVGRGTRLWAKYLGTTAAAATPVVVTWLIVLVVIGVSRHSASVVPLGAEALVTVIAPGLLFVAAFSLVCPVFVSPPVYRVLFFGYWFWGNLMPATVMPSLASTWILPVGRFASAGLFTGSLRGVNYLLEGPHHAGDAVASIALLVAFALAAVVALHLIQRRHLTSAAV